MTMRAMLSYTSASRLTGGPRAFVNGTSYIVESLVQSFAAIMEQIHWYGGMGLGKIATGGVSGNVVTISDTEWASGIWVGGEGMLLDVYRSGSKVLTTEITQVDITNKQLTLASASGLLAGDVLFRKGSYGLESLGAHYILQNQGSLFGIDAAQRKLWEANRYDCSNAALSFEKVSEGISRAYGRGLLGKMKLYVSPITFSTMFPDFNTVKSVANFTTGANQPNPYPGRVFNDESQVKTLEHGVNAIKFFINSVEVEVIASPYVKEGYAFGMSDEGWVRVGSRDLSLGTPGMPEGSYWMQAQDYSALELRAFTDQALFCTKPARQILFTGISNA